MTKIARARLSGSDSAANLSVTGLSAAAGERARNFFQNVADHAQACRVSTIYVITGCGGSGQLQ